MVCSVTNSPISRNYNCYRKSCQSWIRYVFGKVGNNRSKIGARGFFCFVAQKIGFIFFNEISDLFGIKMGFAKLGLAIPVDYIIAQLCKGSLCWRAIKTAQGIMSLFYIEKGLLFCMRYGIGLSHLLDYLSIF